MGTSEGWTHNGSTPIKFCMAGWSRLKRTTFEKAFYAYLDCCEINSKDHGEPIILGRHLMYGQTKFITAIFDGL